MLKKKEFKLIFLFLLLFFLLGVNPVRNIVSNGVGFIFTLPSFVRPPQVFAEQKFERASENLGGFALEIDYPRIPGVDAPQDFVNNPSVASEDIPSLYVNYIFNLAIWAGGVIALVVLIYGGIRYLTSTGKPEAMVSAKDQITAAFFGFLLLFASFLILKTLSPQFIAPKISAPEPIEIVERPEIPLPPVEKVKTSIDVEMPFARVIETIFETYFWQLPDTITWEPRMTRIKNNAETTKKLADNLKQQSEDLKSYSDKCTCLETDPEQACGSNKSEDTTWKCDCGGCDATEPCTSDPCEKVRGDIQNTEQKNLEAIYLGIEITETNADEEEYNIITSLTKEIEKTDAEVKDLKTELNKLIEAERFIESCPWDVLNSLARLHNKQDYFKKQDRSLLLTLFWDDVTIYYVDEWTGDFLGDWAAFYCSVGGTFEEIPYSAPVPGEGDITGEETTEEIAAFGQMTCSREAPVGEIIDRTKRTTNLLINKLETLIEWDKKLIDAVDRLQVLISQCSSKRGCERRCTCFRCGCGSDPCIDLCQGWIYCCADSSPAYSGECLDRDEDTPCPYEEIENQLEEIQNIHQEITDLIKGKEKNGKPTPEEKVENIGIMPIIDEVVPGILKDLQIEVRYPMSICSGKTFEQRDVIFWNCNEAIGSIDSTGVLINRCCKVWDEERDRQTEFGDCLEECYLEKEQTEHRECLHACLDRPGEEELSWCRHRLNFFCCQAN